jgi:hypothetical protein
LMRRRCAAAGLDRLFCCAPAGSAQVAWLHARNIDGSCDPHV